MLLKLWNGAVESMPVRLQPAIRLRRRLSRYLVVATDAEQLQGIRYVLEHDLPFSSPFYGSTMLWGLWLLLARCSVPS